MAKCIGFLMEEAKAAFEHMDFEVVRDFGDYAYGHNLHTWDDGKRMLARCRSCGGYLLIQKSEFHSFTDSDSYYTDYFPVDSEEAADELNRKYDGFAIETQFDGRYLIRDGGRPAWRNGGYENRKQ